MPRAPAPSPDVHIGESDIRRWVGDRSFARARVYVGTSIYVTRRQGVSLKGWCVGSLPEPYAVHAEIGRGDVAGAGCTCPVGLGGHCKHVAALLLTWLGDPAAFRDVEQLDVALRKRSKAELIVLIGTMVEQYPDLERLVELPAAVPPDASAPAPIDPESVRRQVRGAFGFADRGRYGRGRYDRHGHWDVENRLHPILESAQQHAARGDWSNAALMYEAIARESLDQYGTIDDEDGEVGGVVNACVAGLGHCLAATTGGAAREDILRALVDIYLWDVDFGGIGISDEVPSIVEAQAAPDEKRQVALWLCAALPAGDSWSDNDHRQVLGGFLLSLEAETLDDEGFLRLCRETGRLTDVVQRLLALGRVDEAVVDARRADDYALMALSDLFMAAGYTELATALIRERAGTSQDWRLKRWLRDRARERSDSAEALTLTEELFWSRPSKAGYRELAEAAQAAGRWAEMRPGVLERLARQNQHGLRLDILISDGEIDAALAAYDALGPNQAWGSIPVVLAGAAAADHPRAAIRLYGDVVARLIAARGRGSYAEAATYLKRMQPLYKRIGETGAWSSLIADLRLRHKRLRALQEELDKAGL